MVEVGEVAPDFTLSGYYDGDIQQFTLSDYTDRGPVLLGVYVFDFSPVCTAHMCQTSDMDWYQYKKDLTIMGLSRDGPYSHQEFAQAEEIGYPLLSDVDGDVLEAYGLLIPETEGIRGVPRRAVLLIDGDRTIRFKWTADDNWEQSNFGLNPVREAVKQL